MERMWRREWHKFRLRLVVRRDLMRSLGLTWWPRTECPLPGSTLLQDPPRLPKGGLGNRLRHPAISQDIHKEPSLGPRRCITWQRTTNPPAPSLRSMSPSPLGDFDQSSNSLPPFSSLSTLLIVRFLPLSARSLARSLAPTDSPLLSSHRF